MKLTKESLEKLLKEKESESQEIGEVVNYFVSRGKITDDVPISKEQALVLFTYLKEDKEALQELKDLKEILEQKTDELALEEDPDEPVDESGRSYDWYVLVDDFKKPQFQCKYNPAFEDVITELAGRMDCYVVLKKGEAYYAEVGDNLIYLGYTPDIDKICQEEKTESTD